ncbi:hypothetical protein ACH5RR_007086 [Cinchona calisaya]|uniref:Uncharacterized protein n=1 Tax=Cinchona calisaya TaxID=153742 RepID=A0ABD3AQU3_9GENT
MISGSLVGHTSSSTSALVQIVDRFPSRSATAGGPSNIVVVAHKRKAPTLEASKKKISSLGITIGLEGHDPTIPLLELCNAMREECQHCLKAEKEVIELKEQLQAFENAKTTDETALK